MPVTQKDYIFQLAEKLKKLKQEKESIAGALKSVEDEIAQVESELSTQMLNAELQNFNLNGTLYYLSTKTFANIAADAKEEVYSWLKANGYGDLVYETVNAQRFSAFVKELLEEEDELPQGLKDKVNIFEKITIGMRKGGK